MKQIYPKKIKNYSFSNSKKIAQSNICLSDQSIELQKYQSKNTKTDFLLANHNTNQFYMKDFLSTSTMRSLISLFKVSSQKFQSAAFALGIVMALLFSFKTNAQISNMKFSSGTTTYADISGGTSLIAGGNVALLNAGLRSPVTPIGFTFKYQGVDYTQFSAAATGMLQFGASQN